MDLRLREMLKGLEHITFRVETKTDWVDAKCLAGDGIHLKVLENEVLLKMINEMLKGLTTGMTERIAGYILILVWNMRSASDNSRRIFPEKSPSNQGIDVEALSHGVVSPRGTTPIKLSAAGGNSYSLNECVRVGCFLAASLLKLFRKPAYSWDKAKYHIQRAYTNYTKEPWPLKDLNVIASHVGTLSLLWERKTIFRDTLGSILYSIGDLEEGRGMVTMLFAGHLAYTGMHVVDLFCRAVTGLQCQPTDLMKALHTHTSMHKKSILDELRIIIESYIGSEEEDKKRRTFQYARLFDSQMFGNLQSKNCAHLVCILAYLCQQCGSAGTGDPTQIAVIANIGQGAKDTFKAEAINIYNYIVTKNEIEK
ncbi:uncharacterized protein [Malus domestica]|uniref:uncharacterized protein n=1 Tax=Malus domestica TaxID=3750 RepID=UPI003976D3F9